MEERAENEALREGTSGGQADSRPDEEWLEPWVEAGEAREALERELRRELGWRHPLYRRKATAIGRRIDNDDVLFKVEGDGGGYAVVHLTWRKERGVERPWTVFFADRDEWRNECMIPDNNEYSLRDDC